MKKLLFVMSALAALTLLAPAPGSAVTYDNVMAIIFDDPGAFVAGDDLNSCDSDVPMATLVEAYLILINPTVGALYGYEFGFNVEGNFLMAGVVLNGTGAVDVGPDVPGQTGNHIVGLGIPLSTSDATLIATLKIINMDALLAPITITLLGATPNSLDDELHPIDLPALLIEGSIVIPAATSTEFLTITAAINCTEGQVISVDETSWDRLKSMYR